MDFTKFKQEISNIKNWLSKELSSLRTGTASSSVLDNVLVESYGVLTPINQVANIHTESARSIKIVPFDLSQIKAIEKALLEADLGLSIATDSSGVHLNFPELTGERREELVKKAKNILEQSRVTLRNEREKVWSEIQNLEKEGDISQDEKFSQKEKMQKMVDESSGELEEIFKKKELEIKGE